MSMSSRDIDESPGHALTGNNGDTGIERLTVLEFMRKRNPGLAASMDRIVQGIPSEADSVKLAAALWKEWLRSANDTMKRLHSDKPEGQIRPMEEDCLELVAALRAEVRTLRERQKIFRLVPSPAQEAAIAKLAEYLDIMERHSRAIEKPMKEALARADEGAVWHTQDEFNKVVLIIEEIVESVADDQPMGPDIVEARLLRRMAWMPNPRFWPLEDELREFVERMRNGIELRRVNGLWTQLARDEEWRPIIDPESWMFVRKAVEVAGVIEAADALEAHIALIESRGAEIGRPMREALAAGDHETVARILGEFDEVIRTVDGLMDRVRTGAAPERGAAGVELLQRMVGIS